MKALCLPRRGGPDAFACVDVPAPQPSDGELLIRVAAAGVTPTELSWQPTWTTREGRPRSFPIIPGHEFSGVVAAAGRGDAGVAVGDAVYGLNDWYRDGASAEYSLARAEDVALRPRSLDEAQAAITPISALTAWQALFDRAALTAGERVLIHGAAGGVGVFAVQLARWRGAHVISTASARNVAFLRDLGADEVIDYHTTRFEDLGSSIDVVLDTVGGETLTRSRHVLSPGGRLVTIASSLEGLDASLVRSAFLLVRPNRTQLAEIGHLIDAGQVRPVLDAVFPLDRGREAYEHKPVRGKAALRIG